MATQTGLQTGDLRDDRRALEHMSARKYSLKSRILVLNLNKPDSPEKTAAEIREGLCDPVHKWISPKYLYDAKGSEIYEDITRLPEYYQTRTEAAMLKELAPFLAERLGVSEIVELGSGSSTKTRLLFNAWAARRQPLSYVPIDISRTMLEDSATQLIREYPALSVLGLAGQYEDALEVLPVLDDRLFLFLGGTIGNFTPKEQTTFFNAVCNRMTRGNHLLVGFDRAPHSNKPVQVIEDAYNDRQGVTADFNLNLLTRFNREFGGDFDLSQWRHDAVYNTEANQIEMYLESQTRQMVSMPGLSYANEFEEGERILTEISRRFSPGALAEWFGENCGLVCVAQWTDPKEYYSLMLLKKT